MIPVLIIIGIVLMLAGGFGVWYELNFPIEDMPNPLLAVGIGAALAVFGLGGWLL